VVSFDATYTPTSPRSLGGLTVFLDLNGDGLLDAGDPSTTTAADGSYSFSGEPAGTYLVDLLPTVGLATLDPVGGEGAVNIGAGGTATQNFRVILYSPVGPIPVTPLGTSIYGSGNTDANTAYVHGLYEVILFRAPEPAGLALYVGELNQGVSRATVAFQIINSPEHRLDQVTYYYQTYLGRNPDPAAEGYVAFLENGGSERQVVEMLVTSPEYQAKHASNTDFITDLANKILGGSNSAIVNFWNSALNSGTTRLEMATEFINSDASANLEVTGFFAEYLHEFSPTDNIWVQFAETGTEALGQIAADILADPIAQTFYNNGAATVGS
jgi:hypothetical protein